MNEISGSQGDEFEVDFCDVAPCSLVDIVIGMTMEVKSTTEPYVSSYRATRRNIPEDNHLHILFIGLHNFVAAFDLLVRYSAGVPTISLVLQLVGRRMDA
jgi:hypothetical protein